MCGRFTETAQIDKLSQELGIPAEFFPKKIVSRYNVAPGMPVLSVTNQNQKTRADYMQWGLVPVWAKDPKIGYNMINARSETVAEKPSFRGPFKNSRCLIPADGFYEWQKNEKGKQPYYIRMKSKDVFTFAGLWSHWTGKDGTELITCTIMTTSPNSLMKPIHDRMPVIIPKEKRSEWLDTSSFNRAETEKLLISYPEKEMEAYPVSTLVNSPKNNVPECLEPLPTS